MKIIRRPYFTFSLARADAPRAPTAPRTVAARIARIGGGGGGTTTSIENDCSAAPPWGATTLIRTGWAPASGAGGGHSTSPAVPSIVIPPGACRRGNVGRP